MAEFIIDIKEDAPIPVTYIGHAAYTIEEKCAPDVEKRYPVKVSGSSNTEYGIFNTYTGEQWKTLTISSISSDCDCVKIHYNSVEITNADLPLAIDIEALSGINVIPNLEVVVDNYSDEIGVVTKKANITFDLKDIHGTSGGSKISSMQLKLKECSTAPIETPVIISDLSYTMHAKKWMENQYMFEYYIVSQYPVTSYNINNLPTDGGVEFNPVTGFLRINSGYYRKVAEVVILQFDLQAIHTGASPTTDTKTFTLTIKGYSADDPFPI